MNGVIHNCSHGAGTDHNTRLTEEEMMCKVFNYLDHLVQMMQPQKLLYMAIDGVAPRAKVRRAEPPGGPPAAPGAVFLCTFPPAISFVSSQQTNTRGRPNSFAARGQPPPVHDAAHPRCPRCLRRV